MPSITTPLSPYREVDVVPAWVALGDHTITASWWGVPVYVVRQWITSALRKSDYRTAAAFSALLPRSGALVKVAPLVICTRPLTAGRAQSSADMAEAILIERMRLSGVRFRGGFVRGVRKAEYPGGPRPRRKLLPLV